MKSLRYEYLPHTADMAFVGYGKTLQEAIENSALALINIMVDVERIEKAKGKMLSKKIAESAITKEELVWFTLQDILSSIDAGYLKACEFKVESIKTEGKMQLKGRLIHKNIVGDYALLGVKAVTPYDLSVKENKGRFSVHVVVDV